MKRGMSGKGRGGSPPLPRQRAALRVVQLSLLGLAAVAGTLAWRAWVSYSGGAQDSAPARVPASLPEAVGLTLVAAAAVFTALWMGLRAVRGPRPPELG